MKSKLALTIVLASMSVAGHSGAAWQRLGAIDKRPVDLATRSIEGIGIASSQGAVSQAENLISDDLSDSTQFNPGGSEVVVRLHRALDVHRVTFTNGGAEGRVSIHGSVDNQSWIALSQSVFTTADSFVVLKFANAQARCVKLQFDLAKGGTLSSLGIFGADTDMDFPVEEPTASSESAEADKTESDDSSASSGGSPVNAGGGLGGMRIIYINPQVPGFGDDAARYNSFAFPESPERFRTVIYDLGSERTLHEIGSMHSARPVRFSAYTFKDKELPEKEDWRGRMSFDPSVFDTQKPVAVVEDRQGRGVVKAKFSKSVKARYVALRWEPDFNPPAFGVSGMSISVSSRGGAASFSPGAGNGSRGGAGSGASGSGSSGSGSNGGSESKSDSVQASTTNPFSFSSAGFGGGGTPQIRPPARPAEGKGRPRPVRSPR
jgi:hypothetical protein